MTQIKFTYIKLESAFSNKICYDNCPGCGGSLIYVWRKTDTTVGQDEYVPICLNGETTGCLH